MVNPFTESIEPTDSDELLIASIRSGHKEALNQLILRHQAWIYNIVMRMVYDVHEAEDATQEILMKVISKLDSFKGNSAFRTWIYRIAAHHIFNMKKGYVENMVNSFSQYGRELDAIPDFPPSDMGMSKMELKILVEETRIGCIHGMLLCLNREQRFIFILGEVLKVDSQTGAEVMKITPQNFRQRLSRARKDIYGFMDQKCGLVNKENPCRCARKTKGFVQLGIVDPNHLVFTKGYKNKVKEVAAQTLDEVDSLENSNYNHEYQNTPFRQTANFTSDLEFILEKSTLNQLFSENNV